MSLGTIIYSRVIYRLKHMYRPWRVIVAIFLIIFGVSFLFDFSFWRFFWPFVLVGLGVGILVRGSYRHEYRDFMPLEETSEDYLNYSVVFNGLNKKVVTGNFKGGKVVVVFGGGTIDLSSAKIGKGQSVTLQVDAVFGGVKVIVPKTWLITTSMTEIVGGFANHTQAPAAGLEEGRLQINSSAVFGGGEVTN